MTKIIGVKVSRESLAHVLGLSTVFALFGAWLLERNGLKSRGIGPIAFVSLTMFLLSGLYIFWPFLKGYSTSYNSARAEKSFLEAFLLATSQAWNTIYSRIFKSHYRPESKFSSAYRNTQGYTNERRRQNIKSENDPRLNAALFAANVPTFVLDADQRFVDWNPAFSLAFGNIPQLRRGSHVSRWFKSLDNFKKIPKRSGHLYGDAILPITDRERVSYVSNDWGRMVFVKIMTPILDRQKGRIIGWTVVLNINSVNKRIEFFEALYQAVSADTRKRFYAACYDGIFSRDSTRRELIAAHTANLGEAKKVLDLGSFTGELTFRMVREGRHVTAVESDVHLLRRITDKSAGFGSKIRLVKQTIADLRGLPTNRYDGATMLLTVNRLKDPIGALKQIRSTMKQGSILTLSAILAPHNIETLFNAMRQEMTERGHFEPLKDQFNHVLEHERQEAYRIPYQYRSLEDLEKIAEDAGFTVEKRITFKIGPDQVEGIGLLMLKK